MALLCTVLTHSDGERGKREDRKERGIQIKNQGKDRFISNLRLVKGVYNSQTEHSMEMKLTYVDFSRQVAEGCRSSWLQTLGNLLIDRSPYIRYTSRKYYLLYNTT